MPKNFPDHLGIRIAEGLLYLHWTVHQSTSVLFNAMFFWVSSVTLNLFELLIKLVPDTAWRRQICEDVWFVIPFVKIARTLQSKHSCRVELRCLDFTITQMK